MQSNLSVTPYKPSFGIKVADNVINAAKKNYLDKQKVRLGQFNRFLEKINVMKKYGFDNYTIMYGNEGKLHVFYACKDGEKSGIKHIKLIRERYLQNAVTQFLNLTKYDLLLKIK